MGVKEYLAGTAIATAVAFSSAASAQEAPAAPVGPKEACTTIAKENGLNEFPSVRKAFQSGTTLGCEFLIGPNNNHIFTRAYDLNDDRQARQYAASLESSAKADARASDAAQKRAERAEANENPIRDADKTINDINKTVNSANRLLRGLGIK